LDVNVTVWTADSQTRTSKYRGSVWSHKKGDIPASFQKSAAEVPAHRTSANNQHSHKELPTILF